MFCSTFHHLFHFSAHVMEAAGIQFSQSWISAFAFGTEGFTVGVLHPFILHSHLGFQQDLLLPSFPLFLLFLHFFNP